MDPFEPTPEEKQQALIQALSGQQGATSADFMRGWGNILGQGAGALGEMGQGQVKQGMQLDQSRQAGLGQALQLALENQRQANTERHQQMQEDLQRQQISQGRWSLSNPGYGQSYKIDGKTGAIVPIGDERVRPPPGGAGGDNKEWKALMDSVSTNRGRGNKVLTDLQNRLFAGDRIKALAPAGPNGELPDLKPQQLQELATMSAQLAAPGSPTEHSIQSMLPKGMGVGAANILEYLTNEPHGAGQQAFIKMMLQQAEREEGVTRSQLTKAQASQLANFIHLKQRDPGRFNGILEGAGLDPSLIDERGLLIQQPGDAAPALSDQDKQAIAWAKDPANAKNPDAVAILRAHGLAK